MFHDLILFLQIMLINLVLSGDNALVIAMASKNLPDRQRKRAIWWGAYGAVLLRLVLTVAAVYVLAIPYIQAAGALLLMWIAVKLLADDEGPAKVKVAPTFGQAVRTIILADFVMSLDNVLAVAAKAGENVWLLVLGIACSIPIIIWGSSAVMNLLNRVPALVFLGAGILGYTAGEMLLKDEKTAPFLTGEIVHVLLPTALAVLVIVVGLIKQRMSR